MLFARFFDPRKYNLREAGRYKRNKKIILKVPNHIYSALDTSILLVLSIIMAYKLILQDTGYAPRNVPPLKHILETLLSS